MNEETPVVSEVVTQSDDTLAVEKIKSQMEIVISENFEETPSAPELSELVTKSADNLAVETGEILKEKVKLLMQVHVKKKPLLFCLNWLHRQMMTFLLQKLLRL